MIQYFDIWVDYVRLLMFVMNVAALVVMYKRFKAHYNEWNLKTTDIKNALLLWTLSSLAAAPQNIISNTEFGPKTIIGLMACDITLRAVWQKGTWGGKD